MIVLGDIPRLNAKRYPEKIALIEENRKLTYKQLNQQANRIAHGLMKLGISPGDKVAILSYNCLEYPVLYYAIAKCGAVTVPVNFRYKKDELIYAINNSEARVLFFGPEFVSLIEEARSGFISEVRPIAISGETLEKDLDLNHLMDGQSNSDPSVKVDPASPAGIIYTSGTTGSPKGVLSHHLGWMSSYTGMIVEGDVQTGETSLVCIPLFHGGGMHALLQPTLVMGGTAVILGKGFDPEKVLDAVERYGVTMTMWVPTQLAMLANYPGASRSKVSSLRKIWYGSSPISMPVLDACRKLFNVGFYQWYGLTETAMVSVLRPEDHLERSHFTGREFFNAELKVVDAEDHETPVGEVGQIITAQNPLGMIGYYKMEEATRKMIRYGWIYTGDLARVEGNGYFTVVDRLTDMIISGGENIYPAEIENVISHHPGVSEVTVFGIPDDVYGESICAVIVKKKGHDLDSEEIISFCAANLAGYKKPKRVDFMDELPKTASGKVTKNVLRKPYWKDQARKV
jgi:fatty-acyl-CoA synthase